MSFFPMTLPDSQAVSDDCCSEGMAYAGPFNGSVHEPIYDGLIRTTAGVLRLPGNPQIAWSYGSKVIRDDEKGKRYGSKAHAERLTWCKEQGIRLLMCSVNSKNTPQLRILRNNGWSQMYSFRSKDMSETIEMWCVIL